MRRFCIHAPASWVIVAFVDESVLRLHKGDEFVVYPCISSDLPDRLNCFVLVLTYLFVFIVLVDIVVVIVVDPQR